MKTIKSEPMSTEVSVCVPMSRHSCKHVRTHTQARTLADIRQEEASWIKRSQHQQRHQDTGKQLSWKVVSCGSFSFKPWKYWVEDSMPLHKPTKSPLWMCHALCGRKMKSCLDDWILFTHLGGVQFQKLAVANFCSLYICSRPSPMIR